MLPNAQKWMLLLHINENEPGQHLCYDDAQYMTSG